jgi:hypothetical protein
VANVLLTTPEITKLAIEGHTDDRGDTEHNLDLSDRRARSCLRWLVEHGIAESRLTARGYGPQRPIANNATLYGRAKNRRVEFHILEPAALAQSEVQGASSPGAVSKPAPAATATATPPPAVSTGTGAAGGAESTDSKGGKKRRGKKGKAGKDAAAGDAPEADGKPAKKRHHRSKKSK